MKILDANAVLRYVLRDNSEMADIVEREHCVVSALYLWRLYQK